MEYSSKYFTIRYNHARDSILLSEMIKIFTRLIFWTYRKYTWLKSYSSILKHHYIIGYQMLRASLVWQSWCPYVMQLLYMCSRIILTFAATRGRQDGLSHRQPSADWLGENGSTRHAPKFHQAKVRRVWIRLLLWQYGRELAWSWRIGPNSNKESTRSRLIVYK